MSLANRPIFLCNQDVRARTMGCKRGCTCVHVFGNFSSFKVKKLRLPTGCTVGSYTCKLYMSVSHGMCKPCKCMRSTCNTGKENARGQTSLKFPLRHGCVCSHTACTQNIMCMPLFSLGVSATSTFCYKIPRIA